MCMAYFKKLFFHGKSNATSEMNGASEMSENDSNSNLRKFREQKNMKFREEN